MKKFITNNPCFILVVLTILIIVSACSSNEKNIIGLWDTGDKRRPIEFMENGKAIEWEYRSDYREGGNKDVNEEWTWVIQDNQLILTRIKNPNQNLSYKLLGIDDKTMKLESSEGMGLVFTKIIKNK